MDSVFLQVCLDVAEDLTGVYWMPEENTNSG
jgi:hypothetical protein